MAKTPLKKRQETHVNTCFYESLYYFGYSLVRPIATALGSYYYNTGLWVLGFKVLITAIIRLLQFNMSTVYYFDYTTILLAGTRLILHSMLLEYGTTFIHRIILHLLIDISTLVYVLCEYLSHKYNYKQNVEFGTLGYLSTVTLFKVALSCVSVLYYIPLSTLQSALASVFIKILTDKSDLLFLLFVVSCLAGIDKAKSASDVYTTKYAEGNGLGLLLYLGIVHVALALLTKRNMINLIPSIYRYALPLYQQVALTTFMLGVTIIPLYLLDVYGIVPVINKQNKQTNHATVTYLQFTDVTKNWHIVPSDFEAHLLTGNIKQFNLVPLTLNILFIAYTSLIDYVYIRAAAK